MGLERIISDCFRLLNSLNNILPQSWNNLYSYSGGKQIANAFNVYLSKKNNCWVGWHTEFVKTVKIRKLILEMKDSSITKADCLPPKSLKLCPEVFANLFYPLFASILLTRVYPDVWNVAYVRPVHKRGPGNIINNYRPIRLLPKVSLTFEGIIFTFLYKTLHTVSSSAVWVSVEKAQYSSWYFSSTPYSPRLWRSIRQSFSFKSFVWAL